MRRLKLHSAEIENIQRDDVIPFSGSGSHWFEFLSLTNLFRRFPFRNSAGAPEEGSQVPLHPLVRNQLSITGIVFVSAVKMPQPRLPTTPKSWASVGLDGCVFLLGGELYGVAAGSHKYSGSMEVLYLF